MDQLLRSSARRRLAWLLLLTVAIKLAYVFAFTEYSQYLFSDFAGYWSRALERYQGSDKSSFQWALWPPLPHIVLSWGFHVIDVLNLQHHRLAAVLVANVILSQVGVACVYAITLRLVASSRIALLVAAVFALWLPLIYLNAFVMSEHPATTAMLLSIWLLIRFPGYVLPLVIAGATLGFAVGLRPALGLLALPCGLFILLAGPFGRFSIKQAAAFSIGFVLVVGAVVAEVNRISAGNVRGLAANGGLNFYFAQCRTYEVISRDGASVYTIIPPSTVVHPENGIVTISRPIHDQVFFSDLGWQCMRAQPDLWWRSLAKLDDLFFGPLLPTVGNAWGMPEWLPVFRWGALIIACVAPLGLLLMHRARHREVAALLLGIVAMSLLTQYVFNAEHRYLYPILGPMMALAAWSIASAYRLWAIARVRIVGYAATVALVLVGYAAHGTQLLTKNPTLIEAIWFHTLTPFSGRHEAEGRFVVDTLRFPESDRLQHVRRGPVEGLSKATLNFAVVFVGCLEVERAGHFEFAVASDDGYELRIGERVVASHQAPRPYGASRDDVTLGAGRYPLTLTYHQADGRLGISASWRRSFDGDLLMPAVGLRDVGESGDGVRFLPPAECRTAD